MQTNTATADSKFCTTCGRARPLSEFRLRYRDRDVRHNQCRKCATDESRERRHARRRGEFYTAASHIHRARSVNELLYVTSQVNRRLGGPDAFVTRFHDCLKAAEKEGQHYLCFRLLRAAMELMIAAQKLSPPSKSQHDDPSNETPLEKLQANLVILIHDRPEILPLTLKKLPGWRVEPPAGWGEGEGSD